MYCNIGFICRTFVSDVCFHYRVYKIKCTFQYSAVHSVNLKEFTKTNAPLDRPVATGGDGCPPPLGKKQLLVSQILSCLMVIATDSTPPPTYTHYFIPYDVPPRQVRIGAIYAGMLIEQITSRFDGLSGITCRSCMLIFLYRLCIALKFDPCCYHIRYCDTFCTPSGLYDTTSI